MKITKYFPLVLLTLLILLAPAGVNAHDSGEPHDEPTVQVSQKSDTLTTYLIIAGVVVGVCGVVGFLVQKDKKTR